MLITFKTPTNANVVMFGDVAKKLVKIMGQSGTVPSAIGAEDIPQALEKLRKAIDAEPAPPVDHDDDEKERPVSLKHRALPLIGLLEAAHKANDSVMWEAGQTD